MKYQLVWRNKFVTIYAKSIDDMIASLQESVEKLTAMKADGVVLTQGAEDDYAQLETNDPGIARKYGFESSEYRDPDESHFPNNQPPATADKL